MIGTVTHAGLNIGLFMTALGLGFRHGIDWDHIAAISDIAGSQDTPRQSLFYSTCSWPCRRAWNRRHAYRTPSNTSIHRLRMRTDSPPRTYRSI